MSDPEIQTQIDQLTSELQDLQTWMERRFADQKRSLDEIRTDLASLKHELQNQGHDLSRLKRN